MFLSAAPQPSPITVLQTQYTKTGEKQMKTAYWWALGGSLVAGTGAGAGIGGTKGGVIGGVVGLVAGFALSRALDHQTSALVAFQQGTLLNEVASTR